MTKEEATGGEPVIDIGPVEIDSVHYQAIVRAARYLGATIIAGAILVIPQLLGLFHLSEAVTAIATPIVGAFLQGLGKELRGPSIDIPEAVVVQGGSSEVPEQAPSTPAVLDKLPF